MRRILTKSDNDYPSSFKAACESLLRRIVVILVAAVIAVGASFFPGKTGMASAINVTDNGTTIVVDTGAGLVYTIKKANGDMISCKLNGTELTSSAGKYSQIASGLGSAAVTWSTSASGSIVTIAATSSAIMSNGGSITHYYVSRAGENIIYMATYTTTEPSVGELRYIFRGNSGVLSNVPPDSNNSGSYGNVESKDVFGHTDGTTTSKYYGNDQAKDLTVRGDTGNGVGVFMAYGNRETSSGGPFFRDIQFQSGGDSEIYNYMNSGHNQTEADRMGLHGPYALIFTTGSTPSVPDFSWMSSLGLKGWVYDRGDVVVNGLSGMDPNYTYTIGFANSTAQYWASASSTGSAVSPNMIPGTYTMTVYKGELGVYTESVTVTAGNTTTLDTRTITGDPSRTPTIWRIGDWDGTPLEFLNGQNISQWHPSDVRNPSWGPVTFAVGSPTSTFPAVQFRGANSPTTISFNLTSVQAASTHTLKIGITSAYNNGRPSVTINGNAMSYPSPSSQPKSRSTTIGTYRGNNATFSWDIPATDFVVGLNTLTITPISGSTDLSPWLSAGWAYDCVELDTDASIAPITASFDRNPANQADVPVSVQGDQISSITNGSYTLNPSTDYTVSGNVYTISKSYLAALPVGTAALQFNFNSGVHLQLTISIMDTRPPVTTDNAPTGWVNHDVTVNLTPVFDNGTGIAATYYIVDGGTQQTGTTIALTTEGQHTITYWSVDNAGNIEKSKTAIVEIDKTPPTLTITLDKTELWPPNNQLVPIQVTIDAGDHLSGLVSVALTSITSNDSNSGLGDIQGADYNTADTQFSLRATRSGGGTGRVYSITYTATDNAGNATTKTVTVTVPHDMGT